MHKLEILHQCGKRVKTKSQKVLGASFYVYKSYRGKTGRGAFLIPPPSWIGSTVDCQLRVFYEYLLIFYCIFRVYITCWTFWNKNEPYSLSICEVIDYERRAYLNV